jgi:hypothetical protein
MIFLHSQFGFDVGKSVILSGYGFGAVCAWWFAGGCIANLNNMGSVPEVSLISCVF